MPDESYASFSSASVDQALDAARRASQAQVQSTDRPSTLDDGNLKVAAQCISVTVQNGQVCLNLPLGLGSVCLPIPIPVPNGTAAQACLDICTKFGFPCGVEVTVSVAGQRVVSKHFGCSC
ncbi:hypothetical protein [Enterovirga sp.]|jgi:hypothetical protein|uniref:hypothetical protein n=1 Tax=Enterovirga sp. TaxID=2026350 RepID=UPI00261B022E|nr:hypothetical protein [Enterovirga sp.]MDB5591511.1 hypothetical protein [Enterovirga sp.]